MAWTRVRESELWRVLSWVVIAFGLWRLLDLAAAWLAARLIEQYPALAASGGLRWILVTVFGLFAVVFIVALSQIAGRRVALLVAAVLLGINSFQAVAALAWHLGAKVAPGGDLLGLTQYGGEALALAAALAVLAFVPGLKDEGEEG